MSDSITFTTSTVRPERSTELHGRLTPYTDVIAAVLKTIDTGGSVVVPVGKGADGKKLKYLLQQKVGKKAAKSGLRSVSVLRDGAVHLWVEPIDVHLWVEPIDWKKKTAVDPPKDPAPDPVPDFVPAPAIEAVPTTPANELTDIEKKVVNALTTAQALDTQGIGRYVFGSSWSSITNARAIKLALSGLSRRRLLNQDNEGRYSLRNGGRA